MQSRIKYSILFLLILVTNSCGTIKNKTIRTEYKQQKAEIILIATNDYLKNNIEFFEFQENFRIDKIYVFKKMGLASVMFDIGIPQKTIPITLAKNELPKKYTKTEFSLLSNRKEKRLAKKHSSFQYLYLDDLYFKNDKARIEIKLIRTENGRTEYQSKIYEFSKLNNEWKIITTE